MLRLQLLQHYQHVHAKDPQIYEKLGIASNIRCRYTISDLCGEAGLLETTRAQNPPVITLCLKQICVTNSEHKSPGSIPKAQTHYPNTIHHEC